MNNFKKRKLNTDKEKIDNNNERIDLSNKEQREKFIREVRRELKNYDSNYQNIVERRKALEKISSEEIKREQETLKVFKELEDCRF